MAGKTVVVSGAGNAGDLRNRAQQLGAKVVTVSDSTGWIYDPEGIDVELLKEVKEVKRARLTEMQQLERALEYHEGRGVFTVKCDVALPCATQNELHLDDAKALLLTALSLLLRVLTCLLLWKLPNIFRRTVFCLHLVKLLTPVVLLHLHLR